MFINQESFKNHQQKVLLQKQIPFFEIQMNNPLKRKKKDDYLLFSYAGIKILTKQN